MKKTRLCGIATLLIFLITSVAHSEDAPEVDRDGLQLIKDTKNRVTFARPGVEISSYNKIILVDAYVAFKKNWRREQNSADPFRVHKEDVEEIKQEVAKTFNETFSAELEKNGIAVVDVAESGNDVLLVRPAILDLDVIVPDRQGRSRTVSAGAGSLTLYAELYDSVSGQIIARVTDAERDRSSLSLRTEGTNRAALKRIVRDWADEMADHLHQTVTN